MIWNMLKLDDLRKKSAEIKQMVAQRKQPSPVAQGVEDLRNEVVSETAYTPAAEARARNIPIKVGFPLKREAHLLPTKMRNMRTLIDPEAGGHYDPGNSTISLPPNYANWPKQFNKNTIRHELTHSMDANLQTSEQWDNAVNGLGMEDSNKTPVNMLMNGSGITDSMNLSLMKTKKGREAFIKQLSNNPQLYQPDQRTQDIEGLADIGGGINDYNAIEGSRFAKLFKSIYRKR